MTPRLFSVLRRIKRRFYNRYIDNSIRIPTDLDLSDALFYLYQEKIYSAEGEAHMLRDDAAQNAFDRVCQKMSVTPEDLIRMLGILNAREIIDAKIAHEHGIIECHHIKLGFSALSFIQETEARRRHFWVNSVLVPIFLAFFTALLTVTSSKECECDQDSCDCSYHGVADWTATISEATISEAAAEVSISE